MPAAKKDGFQGLCYGAVPMLVGSGFDAGITAPLVVWYNAQQQYGLGTVQAAKQILKERGPAGFFKGADGIIATKMIQRSFKSLGMGIMLPLVNKNLPDQSPVVRGVIYGGLAATLVEVPGKQPAELARLLASDMKSPYTNSLQAVKALYAHGGLKGVFGPALVPSMLVSGIWTCTFVGGREYCKTLKPEGTAGQVALQFMQGFGLGALAGGLSTPPEMIRAVMAKDLNKQFQEVHAGTRKAADIKFTTSMSSVLSGMPISRLFGGLGVKLVRAGVGGFALNFGMTATEKALDSVFGN